MTKRLLSAVLLAVSMPAAPAFAEGVAGTIGESRPGLEAPREGKPWDFQLGGSAGAASVTNWRDGRTEIFNAIAFQPELAVGKLGIGLDIYLYFDRNGRVRKQDWDSGSDFVNKIWYARWGKKGEPVFARLGGLTSATIGHGFIMGNYSNRRRYPDERLVGAQLDLDFGAAGFESVLTDVQRADIMGGRVYVRPLSKTEAPFVKDLAVGFSAVADLNPDMDERDHSDQVAVYGVDLDQPLFKSDAFSAALFADAAQMRLGSRYTRRLGCLNNGRGFTGGVRGNVLFFDYKGELRSLDNNFIPGFFDGYYEVDRSTAGVLKADSVSRVRNPNRRGTLLDLGANLFQKIRLGATYENYNVDPERGYPQVRAEARVDPSLLLGKFELAGLYTRRNVDKMRDLGRTNNRNTVLTGEASYLAKDNLRLVWVFKQTYDDLGRPVRSTQIRTDVRF